jgi:hypothetical protein
VSHLGGSIAGGLSPIALRFAGAKFTQNISRLQKFCQERIFKWTNGAAMMRQQSCNGASANFSRLYSFPQHCKGLGGIKKGAIK